MNILTVPGSHDSTSPHELGRLVWPVMQESMARRREVLDRLGEAIGTQRHAAGAVTAYGLLKGNKTAAIAGGLGTAYAYKRYRDAKGRTVMRTILYIVAAIFIVMWIAGFIFRYIVSPLVHLLLIAALVIIVLRFAGSKIGRKVE
jgi:hypothetical protein